MKDFSTEFNQIIVEAYHNLLLMEETKRKYSHASFSFRDRNAVAYLLRNPEGTRISDLADYLKISRPSATTLVKKLEKYELIERVPKPGNSKVTLLKATRKGKRFSSYQRRYRERLTERVNEEFTDEEKEILYKGFSRLNDFFIESINESEEKHK
ncbi:MAG: MarR family transcriptional regulator [Firmicutes bacterium]|nr:MarR family transcriptional regulator [Bacillota bacterium]